MINHPNEIKNTVESLNYKYNKKTNFLYITIILMFIIAIISLPFIKVDISSQSRGIVRSYKENISISPIVQGKVIFVNLKNNLYVKQGEKLLEVESSILDIQQNTKNELLSDLYKQYQDLNQLGMGNYLFGTLKTALYQKELSFFLEQINELKVKNQEATNKFNRAKKGFDAGVTSNVEFEQISFELKTSNANISTLYEQQKSSWQAKKRQVEEQIKSISGEMVQLHQEKKNYIINAPISGTVINYTGINVGSFLNGNNVVAEISPDDEIIIDCLVSPTDIGFIHLGQEANLQFDAFNYNQWGLGKAIVSEIDKNLTVLEKDIFFKVKCKLLTKKLQLKNGYKVQIKKGMTLTARFKIIKRSLWDLLYDKVDNWLNPKIK